ncbi:Cystathionine gamma-lyase [Dirofilaria immitis]|nr:Cystathionine gamma-lyase [Dirofilaria immitis]
MQAHMANAMQIATFLENNPRIERVFYPELQSHPQHEIHKKQAKGMSGMMSFYLKGGLEESEEFLSNLKIFTLAESLGGFESLAELPASMTHASVPMEDRIKLGINDNLVRLSVGIEDAEDLIQDLDQALKKLLMVVKFHVVVSDSEDTSLNASDWCQKFLENSPILKSPSSFICLKIL